MMQTSLSPERLAHEIDVLSSKVITLMAYVGTLEKKLQSGVDVEEVQKKARGMLPGRLKASDPVVHDEIRKTAEYLARDRSGKGTAG